MVMIAYWKDNFISESSTGFETPNVLNDCPFLKPLCWPHQGNPLIFRQDICCREEKKILIFPKHVSTKYVLLLSFNTVFTHFHSSNIRFTDL